MSSSVGVLLRELRIDRQLSLSKLAEIAGVSKSTLSTWENGAYQPQIPELESTLRALRVTDKIREHAISLVEAPRAVKHVRDVSGFAKAEEELGSAPSAGDLLKAMRIRLGWRLEQTAAAMNTTSATLSRWEQGKITPPPERLETLLTLLKAKPEERNAFRDAKFLQTLSFKEQILTIETMERELFKINGGPDFQLAENPLSDLQFLLLERQSWTLAAKQPEAKLMLARIYANHAQHLGLAARWVESAKYANRAVDLMPPRQTLNASTTEYFLQGSMLAVRAASEISDMKTAKQGAKNLLNWVDFPKTPEQKAALYECISMHLGWCNELEAALLMIDRSLDILKATGNKSGYRHRLWHKVRVLGPMGRAEEGIALLNEQETEKDTVSNIIDAMVMGESYLRLKENSEASSYVSRAYELAEDGHASFRPHIDVLAKSL